MDHMDAQFFTVYFPRISSLILINLFLQIIINHLGEVRSSEFCFTSATDGFLIYKSFCRSIPFASDFFCLESCRFRFALIGITVSKFIDRLFVVVCTNTMIMMISKCNRQLTHNIILRILIILLLFPKHLFHSNFLFHSLNSDCNNNMKTMLQRMKE